MVLWCDSLLKRGDEQTQLVVGRPFFFFFFFFSVLTLNQCTVDLTTTPVLVYSGRNGQPTPSPGALMSNVAFRLLLVHALNRCRAANVSERTDRP